MRFLSFGAGVQTTALLLMDSYDEIIFADTQGEHPETYDYMERFVLPYCKEKAIKFTVLDSEVQGTKSLEQFCLDKRATPSRRHRWCTEKFKIRRIANYVKASGNKGSTCVIGISFDEVHRMHESHSRAYSFEYPLIDKRLTRQDCKKVIADHGWPEPPKSGCFYCPFAKMSHWKELYHNHPDLFQRARLMEENQANPDFVLAGNGEALSRLAHRFGEGDMSLDDFDDSCKDGYCFT